jgi:hypothetical protein
MNILKLKFHSKWPNRAEASAALFQTATSYTTERYRKISKRGTEFD